MLLAKIAAPQAAHAELQYSLLSQAAESRLTVFTAPAGYLCTDSFTAVLKEHNRPTVWLRLGPEDADPAICLVSLIASAQRLCPTVGLTTLERMRRHPGPTAGWPPLFAHLGQELAKALPASTTLVLEHVHHLGDAHTTLGLLGAHLLPSLPTSTTCILTSHGEVPPATWPPYAIHRDTGDLRLDAGSASALFQRAGFGLPTHCIERAVALTAGRADVLAGLCAASVGLGPALVQQAVERAADLDDLLSHVTSACLVTADADTLQALALAAHLEYSHPALVQATLGNVTLPASPWLQALADDWTRVRCVCKTPLHAALRERATPSYATLHRMADYLASHEAIEQAVSLYCEIGDTASAARAIGQVADTMLNLGQWQTLSNWLDQLTRQAQKGAERPSTPKPTSLWSRLLGALGQRRRPSRPAAPLEWYDLTPQETLQDITEAAGETSPERATGTSRAPDSSVPTPLIPTTAEGPASTVEALPTTPGAALASEEPTQAQLTSSPGLTAAPVQTPTLTADLATEAPPPLVPVITEELLPAVEAVLTTPDTALTPPLAVPSPVTNPPESTAAPIQVPSLTAHLLGMFRVSVNDQPVQNWASGRGRSVFKYLLIHHNRSIPRDVLMDVFWPDADPEAARNRLHVALHNIRQKLRAVIDLPVVIFEDGAYGLNPDFHVWVDLDEFDRHVETGRRLEATRQIAKATAEYELAIGLYQNDLLADDPYEEWPVLMREQLRVAYLDTLDRLSHIYFDRSEYAACAALCQLILARDNCREDAHCLLMGCYSRQGQHHLALRQYQACVEALQAELQVGPAPTTTQLVERIRRHEPV